ncbi:MAG: hypothetical protein ACOC43_06225, partial [Desulfohalobiaceae bacterium]
MRKNGEVSSGYSGMEDPEFGPNGQRMAYLAQMGKQHIVIEEDEVLGTYQWAGLLTFSPDGQYLAYGAAEEGESFLVVEDQKGQERFVSFYKGSPMEFTKDNVIKTIGLRNEGREFHLLRAEIE